MTDMLTNLRNIEMGGYFAKNSEIYTVVASAGPGKINVRQVESDEEVVMGCYTIVSQISTEDVNTMLNETSGNREKVLDELSNDGLYQAEDGQFGEGPTEASDLDFGKE